MLTLYDADRCPYCARVRIVLAEKVLPYETVVVDLDAHPAVADWAARAGARPSIAAETALLAAR